MNGSDIIIKGKFPGIIANEANRLKSDSLTEEMRGYLFEGVNGFQMVAWVGEKGGPSPMHKHEYDEYCVVLQGWCDVEMEDGETYRMLPGDECLLPAGVMHGGRHSPDYRAIDVFASRRFHYANPNMVQVPIPVKPVKKGANKIERAKKTK